MSAVRPLSAPEAPPPREEPRRAGFGPTLALTVTVAFAGFLLLMAVVLLLVHPEGQGLGAFASVVKQNQKAKTFLYLAAFLAILPLALVFAPRLADAIAASPNASGLPFLAATAAGSLAAVLVILRTLSASGLNALLVAMILWSAAFALALARALGGRPWPALLRCSERARPAWIAAGVLVFATLVATASSSSLHVLPLVLGGLVGAAVLASQLRPSRTLPRLGRRSGLALDLVVLALLAVAIPNVVIFHTTGQTPSIYLPPGLYQNQQDYLLGSVNQLLGGGALLVNVPVSQYGVGLVYFLGAWFHLAPIGYGTLGFLDGIITALFYAAGYLVLRVAGVRRPLAIAALGVAVVALVYGLHYPVGALPETGPMRFGLPIALLLARIVAVRRPGRARAADAFSFCVLGLASIWAFEAFAYTLFVFAVTAATQAWLMPSGRRRSWIARQAVLAIAACVIAHVGLALATLLGTGHLPDWGQYLAYLRSFLLGGRAGTISYGFARWSPGLAFAGGVLASSAALALLLRRTPDVARSRPAMVVALAGATAYGIALLSYTDNRSSTYLLPYVALPLLLAGALWLALLWDAGRPAAARGALAFALATSVLLVTAAWPFIGRDFSQTALAHTYSGGGLRAALHRLWHEPPIDPRAPAGDRLLRAYVPGKRVLILLPTRPDLGVEILMRSGRVNSLFISDPIDDSLVFSTWKPRLTQELDRLRAGQRLLADRKAFEVLARLRAHPSIDPASHPLLGGDREVEWLLWEIDRRFELRPIVRDPSGLIVAELVARRG